MHWRCWHQAKPNCVLHLTHCCLLALTSACLLSRELVKVCGLFKKDEIKKCMKGGQQSYMIIPGYTHNNARIYRICSQDSLLKPAFALYQPTGFATVNIQEATLKTIFVHNAPSTSRIWETGSWGVWTLIWKKIRKENGCQMPKKCYFSLAHPLYEYLDA